MWLHNTPGSCGLVKRLDYGLRPDAESVLLPAHNMHGFEFAALDSLQNCLVRDPRIDRKLSDASPLKRALSSSVSQMRQGD